MEKILRGSKAIVTKPLFLGRAEETLLRTKRLLSERGANPHPQNSPWGTNMLRRAARLRSLRAIRLLLQNLCDRGVTSDELWNVIRCSKGRFRTLGSEQDLWLQKAHLVMEGFYWWLRYPLP